MAGDPLPHHGPGEADRPPRRGGEEAGRKAAAFFDLDKTVIAKSATLAFGRPFYRAGLLDRRGLLRTAIAQIVYLLFGADDRRMEKLRSALLTLTAGWDKKRVEELVRETVEKVAAPLVYAEALALMEEHRREDRRVYIISSAPEEVVKPVARYLGIDDVIATRSKVDEEGRYTGELEFYAYGPWKAEALRWLEDVEGVALADSYAYSDGITDLPLLEAVGHPVAVNPDRGLRLLAAEREWPVLEFARPVTLRSRLAMPAPIPLVSGLVIGGAAAAVVAVALLRARRTARPGGLAARLASGLRQ